MASDYLPFRHPGAQYEQRPFDGVSYHIPNGGHIDGIGRELANGPLRPFNYVPPENIVDIISKAEIALKNEVEENRRLKRELQILKDSALSPGHLPRDFQGNGVASTSKDQGKLAHNNTKLSPPTSRPLSPSRDLEVEIRTPQDDTPHNVPEMNGFKAQDMMLTAAKHQEDEIFELRSCLSALSRRETQLQCENQKLHKCLMDAQMKEHDLLCRIRKLEHTISELRQDFDQQQQMALSERGNLMNENVKLHYELQTAEDDRNLCARLLLPLLNEHNMQPPTNDLHSMVSTVKVLVQYIRDKLNANENKLKELQQGQSWPVAVYAVPSPPRSASNQSPPPGRGLEIVAQTPYIPVQRSSPSSPINSSVPPHQIQNNELEHDGIRSPPATLDQQIVIRPPDTDHDNDRTVLQPSHLPPLPEEPNSSSVEDDDPLPAVEGLRVVGEAILGSKVTVCGISINGTSLCHFQWLRRYPHRDTDYSIEGASETEYTINADDCDTIIGIRVCPLDDRGRKGKVVIEYANGGDYIRCDSALEAEINGFITSGHASFEVQLLIQMEESSVESYEPGTFILKRSGFEVRRNGGRKISEKYTPNTKIWVPAGPDPQCILSTSDEVDIFFEFVDNRIRDAAVLTMKRLQAALEEKRRKGSWLSKIVT